MYCIYFLLEAYVIVIEIRHIQFAFYFYHLLTSIQPLQTNHNIKWDDINIECIDAVYNAMYQYQATNYVLVNECNVHPNIVGIILLYLVYSLPEDGEMRDLEQMMLDSKNDEDIELISITSIDSR